MAIFSVLKAILLSSVSFAAVTCPTAYQLKVITYTCGMNDNVVNYASLCSDKLLAESRLAGQALSTVMEALQKKLASAQSGSMGDAQSRLKMGIAGIETEIESLQKNTTLISSYTDAMIDLPGSKSDATSLPCFNRNYHALQKIVTQLDDQIIGAMHAREAALAMAASLGGQQGNLNSLGGTAPVSAGPAKSAPVPALSPRGQSPQQGSNVTGVEDDLKREQKQP
jgi:hypothetical protein